jgi:hypothetical protein
MDLRRLRAGEWITGLGGVALLGSLFMAWYDTPRGTRTAWESFAVLDLLLAAVALFAISLVPVTATQRVPAVPLAQDVMVAIVGKLALVLVLIRIAWTPDGATGVEAGAWIAVVDVLVIVAGGWIAMHDERLPSPGRVTDLTGVPSRESPSIETLPAP